MARETPQVYVVLGVLMGLEAAVKSGVLLSDSRLPKPPKRSSYS